MLILYLLIMKTHAIFLLSHNLSNLPKQNMVEISVFIFDFNLKIK
jgi:hypothetical protein